MLIILLVILLLLSVGSYPRGRTAAAGDITRPVGWV